MPVEVKGRVVYNQDNEDQEYLIDCKQLGISEDGTGTIEDDVERLRLMIEQAIAEEFHVAPKAGQIIGYTLNLSFSIEGAINKTLDEFVKKED